MDPAASVFVCFRFSFPSSVHNTLMEVIRMTQAATAAGRETLQQIFGSLSTFHEMLVINNNSIKIFLKRTEYHDAKWRQGIK